MNTTQKTGLVIVIMISIVIIARLVIDKIVSGKLEQYLLMKDYDRLEKTLDSFFCKVTYTPFRREMLRLNGYSMQGDVGRVEQQFSFMFSKMRLTSEQEIILTQRGFYYYMEQKEYKKAEQLLNHLKKIDSKNHSVKIMDIMYDILVRKETKYIDVLKASIKHLENSESKNIGIIEYLIGLQYSYLNDADNMKTYLNRASINCKNTEYEAEINRLLAK